MENLLDLLDARRSTPSRFLAAPGPDADSLQRLLRSAARVPDHGGLTPWRFLLIRGAARERLGDVLARRCIERDPDAADSAIDKERNRFSHAPLIVAVVARIQPGHRIPEQEQLLSAGCVCFSLLLGAEALGFGAQWLTGWAAYDPHVAQALGLQGGERIAGFVHIGSIVQPATERSRPVLESLLSEWRG